LGKTGRATKKKLDDPLIFLARPYMRPCKELQNFLGNQISAFPKNLSPVLFFVSIFMVFTLWKLKKCWSVLKITKKVSPVLFWHVQKGKKRVMACPYMLPPVLSNSSSIQIEVGFERVLPKYFHVIMDWSGFYDLFKNPEWLFFVIPKNLSTRFLVWR